MSTQTNYQMEEQLDQFLMNLAGNIKKSRSETNLFKSPLCILERVQSAPPAIRSKKTTEPKIQRFTELPDFSETTLPNYLWEVRKPYQLSKKQIEHHKKGWNARPTNLKKTVPKIRGEIGKMSKIRYSTAVLGSDKNQDEVRTIVLADNSLFCMGCDGHGDDTAIDFIRSISDEELKIIAQASNPMHELELRLQLSGLDTIQEDSGVCLSMSKINNNSGEFWWLGDYRIIVWANNNRVWINESHDGTNPEEVKRVQKIRGAKLTKERSMKPVSKKHSDGGEMRAHIEFNNELFFAHSELNNRFIQPTAALGHAHSGKPSITGGQERIGYKNIKWNNSDKILVLSASDGMFDLCHEDDIVEIPDYNNALECVNHSMQCWGGPIYVNGSCQMGHGCKRGCCKTGSSYDPSKKNYGKISSGMFADDISAYMIEI